MSSESGFSPLSQRLASLFLDDVDELPPPSPISSPSMTSTLLDILGDNNVTQHITNDILKSPISIQQSSPSNAGSLTKSLLSLFSDEDDEPIMQQEEKTTPINNARKSLMSLFDDDSDESQPPNENQSAIDDNVSSIFSPSPDIIIDNQTTIAQSIMSLFSDDDVSSENENHSTEIHGLISDDEPTKTDKQNSSQLSVISDDFDDIIPVENPSQTEPITTKSDLVQSPPEVTQPTVSKRLLFNDMDDFLPQDIAQKPTGGILQHFEGSDDSIASSDDDDNADFLSFDIAPQDTPASVGDTTSDKSGDDLFAFEITPQKSPTTVYKKDDTPNRSLPHEFAAPADIEQDNSDFSSPTYATPVTNDKPTDSFIGFDFPVDNHGSPNSEPTSDFLPFDFTPPTTPTPTDADFFGFDVAPQKMSATEPTPDGGPALHNDLLSFDDTPNTNVQESISNITLPSTKETTVDDLLSFAPEPMTELQSFDPVAVSPSNVRSFLSDDDDEQEEQPPKAPAVTTPPPVHEAAIELSAMGGYRLPPAQRVRHEHPGFFSFFKEKTPLLPPETPFPVEEEASAFFGEKTTPVIVDGDDDDIFSSMDEPDEAYPEPAEPPPNVIPSDDDLFPSSSDEEEPEPVVEDDDEYAPPQSASAFPVPHNTMILQPIVATEKMSGLKKPKKAEPPELPKEDVQLDLFGQPIFQLREIGDDELFDSAGDEEDQTESYEDVGQQAPQPKPRITPRELFDSDNEDNYNPMRRTHQPKSRKVKNDDTEYDIFGDPIKKQEEDDDVFIVNLTKRRKGAKTPAQSKPTPPSPTHRIDEFDRNHQRQLVAGLPVNVQSQEPVPSSLRVSSSILREEEPTVMGKIAGIFGKPKPQPKPRKELFTTLLISDEYDSDSAPSATSAPSAESGSYEQANEVPAGLFAEDKITPVFKEVVRRQKKVVLREDDEDEAPAASDPLNMVSSPSRPKIKIFDDDAPFPELKHRGREVDLFVVKHAPRVKTVFKEQHLSSIGQSRKTSDTDDRRRSKTRHRRRRTREDGESRRSRRDGESRRSREDGESRRRKSSRRPVEDDEDDYSF